jgi:predicted ATPase/DNA-binding winged helix-turn-helix (wHTH) protein
MDGHAISFGPFRLLAKQRLLLEGEKPVRLGSRAFDILAALVERAGEVVRKEELIARAWPQTFVEEANLKIQVSALRRALGDGQGGHRYIVTVPGRGYNFVAPLSAKEAPQAQRPTFAPAGKHNLPLAVTRMIGRDEAVAALVTRLSRQRLVMIVGPGGIGKTTVALAVAERMIASYEHGVWLVDLAPLENPGLVLSAVATVLGREIRTEDPLPGLLASLRDQRMLLLLDNCEHVIEGAVRLATAILSGVPGINILATSREPLGVAGESGYRLGPLSLPPPSSRPTAAEAAVSPAVQLFVARVTAIVEDFALTDANAPLVVEICRKLDGLPLAIEFAACRVEVLGVEGLARLDDSLRLLGTSRRTAMPRHRTMRAVVDWSYGLLGEDEQLFFQALGIFAGGFTVEAAATVAMDGAKTRVDAIDRLADLAVKSLVVADVSGAKPRFHLLGITRAYALAKIAETGEVEALARRHAVYYRNLLWAGGKPVDRKNFAATLAPELDNIRAALSWAFAPAGDKSIAVALAEGSAPIWLEMSLLSECHAWMEKALDILDPADRGSRRELVLQTAFGLALMFVRGMSERVREALTRASELTERVDDVDFQLRAITGLMLFRLRSEDPLGALARRGDAIARRSADGAAISELDSITSSCYFVVGDYGEALTHAERAHGNATPNVRLAQVTRSGLNSSILARCVVAQILWLQGRPDQAARATEDLVADAQTQSNPASLCLALAWTGCRVSLWLSDLESAERSIALLKEQAGQYGFTSYYACGLGFEGTLEAKRGDVAGGERLARACLDELYAASWGVGYTVFRSMHAEILIAAGDADAATAAAEDAVERTEAHGALWWMPEALRIKGEALLVSGTKNHADAEKHFHRSLDLARGQGALSWELRAATSLARLLRDQGRSADAIARLQPIYGRFTEGFNTADLIAAKQLLEALADADRR